MKHKGFKTFTYHPPAGRWSWRRLAPASFAVCIAATGAAAWDALRPWSNPMEAALATSSAAQPNTPESRASTARIQQLMRPGAEAMVRLADLGDETSKSALASLAHAMRRQGDGSVTIEQIRRRREGMSDADFLVWLNTALR